MHAVEDDRADARYVWMTPEEAARLDAALHEAIDALAADPLTAASARVLREFRKAHRQAHNV